MESSFVKLLIESNQDALIGAKLGIHQRMYLIRIITMINSLLLAERKLASNSLVFSQPPSQKETRRMYQLLYGNFALSHSKSW